MGPNEYNLIQMRFSLKFLSGHFEFVTFYLGLVSRVHQGQTNSKTKTASSEHGGEPIQVLN